ncbi:MAG: hypothetical protein M3Y69_11845 [Verrucomicrobiota bacterium]|nr:hypothetical protein [Verrucomicrobiota bacterium]
MGQTSVCWRDPVRHAAGYRGTSTTWGAATSWPGLLNVIDLDESDAGGISFAANDGGIVTRGDPQNAHAQQSLAISYIHYADLLGGPEGPNLGLVSAATENYDRAVALLEAVTRTDAQNVSAARDLAEARTKRARLAATTATK